MDIEERQYVEKVRGGEAGYVEGEAPSSPLVPGHRGGCSHLRRLSHDSLHGGQDEDGVWGVHLQVRGGGPRLHPEG